MVVKWTPMRRRHWLLKPIFRWGTHVWRIAEMGFSGIMVNRWRSLLSTLGIILGVFAVIVLMSLGNGVQKEITDELEALGPNLIRVTPGNPEVRGNGPLATPVSSSTLTPKDVKEIAGLPTVAAASGSVPVDNASVGGKKLPLTGVDPSYPKIQSVDLVSGRFVERAGEIVLDEPVVKNLLQVSSKDAVGKIVPIQNKSYKVVGIVAANAKESTFGLSIPQTSFVTTDDALALSGGKNVGQILVEAKDSDSVEAAASEIKSALKSAHSGTEDFGARSQDDLLSRFTRITDMLNVLLYFIASITLLILGIGIMNMMLASVTDRTKEIGVRKALGATDVDVLLQFLFEALFLTSIGGAVGIILGVIVSKLLPHIITNAPTLTSPTLIALTFGVSVLSGLVFGVLPAYRAARLEPVEALRR
ncbi:MAG: ABC transporter permease [Rubrobacter sp.]|nr:ABC transporter permease [Rubrobacter sp.]